MIGILGAYGAVGIWATRFIQEHSDEKLRLGGRHIEKVDAEIRKEFEGAEWMQVNVQDRESLDAFMRDCDCILDCAKLSLEQAHLMDILAEEKNIPIAHLGIVGYERRSAKVPVLYGSGSIPGLSGLIPQAMAEDFDRVEALDFYYGGVGAFSYTAAKDYLEGIFENSNHSMVCWERGKTVPFTPSENDVSEDLGKFLSDYKAFPYFDEEAAAVTRKLNLNEARFEMCVGGKRTLEAMNSARFQYKQDPEKTIEGLCFASKLDSFGLTEDAFFLCLMSGEKDGAALKKKLWISGLTPSQFTGKTAGALALCLLGEKIPGGVLLLGESSLAHALVNMLKKNEPHLNYNLQDLNCNEIEGEI